MSYTPIETAVALSLYAFNVSAAERAKILYDHFGGDCAELVDLVRTLSREGEFAVTQLAMPTAVIYVQHALVRYGREARMRVNVEREHSSFDFPDDVCAPVVPAQMSADMTRRLDDAMEGAVALTADSRKRLLNLAAWARLSPTECLEQVLKGAYKAVTEEREEREQETD